jgi:ent-kaurene synthase
LKDLNDINDIYSHEYFFLSFGETGLHFIGTNFSIVMDEQITAPIGFNITFTGMISLATGMGLEFPGRQTDVDAVLHIREMELNRLIIRHF